MKLLLAILCLAQAAFASSLTVTTTASHDPILQREATNGITRAWIAQGSPVYTTGLPIMSSISGSVANQDGIANRWTVFTPNANCAWRNLKGFTGIDAGYLGIHWVNGCLIAPRIYVGTTHTTGSMPSEDWNAKVNLLWSNPAYGTMAFYFTDRNGNIYRREAIARRDLLNPALENEQAGTVYGIDTTFWLLDEPLPPSIEVVPVIADSFWADHRNEWFPLLAKRSRPHISGGTALTPANQQFALMMLNWDGTKQSSLSIDYGYGNIEANKAARYPWIPTELAQYSYYQDTGDSGGGCYLVFGNQMVWCGVNIPDVPAPTATTYLNNAQLASQATDMFNSVGQSYTAAEAIQFFDVSNYR